MVFLTTLTTLVGLIMLSTILGIICDLIHKRNKNSFIDRLGSFFRSSTIVLILITGFVLVALVFSIPSMITI